MRILPERTSRLARNLTSPLSGLNMLLTSLQEALRSEALSHHEKLVPQQWTGPQNKFTLSNNQISIAITISRATANTIWDVNSCRSGAEGNWGSLEVQQDHQLLHRQLTDLRSIPWLHSAGFWGGAHTLKKMQWDWHLPFGVSFYF